MRALAAGSVVLLLPMLAGCRSLDRQVLIAAPEVVVDENGDPSFAVGVVPTMAPPVRVGTVLGFRLSSNLDGYGHLYVISAMGDVTRLTENLPLEAGVQVDYPQAGDAIQLRASPPAGINHKIGGAEGCETAAPLDPSKQV